jgi:hypothetical protein
MKLKCNSCDFVANEADLESEGDNEVRCPECGGEMSEASSTVEDEGSGNRAV